MAKLSVDIAIGLIGVMCFWLGIFKVAEAAGIIEKLAYVLSPLFERLMPQVPTGHSATGSVTMNMAANMLGLDNAATPMGLKAMKDLQSLNPEKNRASDAQILFLVINTSSVTLLPVTIFMYRAQMGAAEPTSVFLPILMATTISTIVGLLTVAWIQKLKVFDWVVMGYLSAFALLISALAIYTNTAQAEEISKRLNLIGNLVLLLTITGILTAGIFRNLPIFELFTEGAKEGISVCIKIVPYLVAMLVAIGLFRASGVLDLLVDICRTFVVTLGVNAGFVEALPTAFMKPFSGSGSRAMMIETMNNYGVDSFPAKVAAVVQGSTETTFYVLAVYFGSVGISDARYALYCGLVADFAGIVAAILLGYWFFVN